MKITYRSLLPIILVLLIFQSGAIAEYNSEPGAKEAEYIIVDHEGFNKSVMSAKAEEWTSDPVTVSLKFTGPFEGTIQNIDRKNKSAESPETATVTITNEGLLDDSVMGEKYLLLLKRTEHGAWLITTAGKLVKCREGRGHQNYSNKPCN